MSNIIVTIDGGAGTGTSSLARGLSKALGWPSLNSGHLYRSVAYVATETGVATYEPEKLVAIAAGLQLEYKDGSVIGINGQQIESSVLDEMSSTVHLIAHIAELREHIRALQIAYTADTDECIVEGRDLGTVVFPDATLKLFLTCDDKERARRRSNQVGKHITVADLLARDKADTDREHSPMIPAEDAIVLDTTETSVPELIDTASVLLRGKPQARRIINATR